MNIKAELRSARTAVDALKCVPTGVASRIVGVCPATLVAMERRGAIKSTRTPTNRRLWDVTSYVRARSEITPK